MTQQPPQEVKDDAAETPDTPETPAPAESPEIEIDEPTLQRHVEAVLMSVEKAISLGKLAEACGLDTTKPIKDAIEALNAFYEEHDRSFTIEQVAGGYQILTLPQYKDTVATLHKTKVDNKLSAAALETLAIIAYKQPILRADVETIRGVSAGEVIRSLMDKHLVKIVGRAEEIGRPMLYGTTKTFLEVFGLSTLKDLPKAEELQKP
ncbi:SMC-Scp complex subunit ScpB [Planctomycetales bacterium ZRK34]|nr:SMC-Scp complex subunit ScpB [Planctomycetales bacterium ZRK34]